MNDRGDGDPHWDDPVGDPANATARTTAKAAAVRLASQTSDDLSNIVVIPCPTHLVMANA
jgi:hypothetical protein